MSPRETILALKAASLDRSDDRGGAVMTAPRIILALDLGVTGACVICHDGVPADFFDMPCLNDGPAGRRSINAPLLAQLVFESHASAAFVEAVGPRPGEGAVGAFAFGRAKGLVEGTLATARIPLTWITSPTWKRIVGIPPGKEGAKDAARSEAIRRWPDKAAWFARVKDHGRAEACLIGWAGSQREARDV
jgi:crossover junction endodeoxyribonuclease RuvC